MNVPVFVRVPAANGSASVARRGEPVRFGLPLPQGECHEPARLVVRDADGRRLPSQARPLDTWSDGSLRWVLVDFLADVPAGGEARYGISIEASEPQAFEGGLSVVRRDEQLAVDSGDVRFVLGKTRFPFIEVLGPAGPLLEVTRSGLEIEGEQGQLYSFGIDELSLEESGPIRVVVRMAGRIIDANGKTVLEAVIRLHFVHGTAAVRFELGLRNPRAADHPGGCWDLGGGGSVLLRDISLRLSGPSGETFSVRCSPEIGLPFADIDTPFEIYQDSSGGDQWNSSCHVNRERAIPVSFRGYKTTAGADTRHGLRASPVVSMRSAAAVLTVAAPGFWQNFPKAITVDHGTLSFGLFPGQFGDQHELQGGERKTHVFVVGFAEDTVSDSPWAWVHAPSTLSIDPAWCARCGIVAPQTVGTAENSGRYAQFTASAIEGDDSFERKREAADEFGWRHFGDLPADHEAVNTGTPLVSHYNNQYDAIAGMAIQYLSTGDARWFTAMHELAAHVADIDIYHTDRDKAAYNNGLFWHTNHLTDADTATHRAYPRRAGHGGGPSAEHNYTTGFMLHHFLTGSAWSREAVFQLAGWVIAMDDGRRTRFGWIDSGPTGTASCTVAPDYHSAGRGAGNSLNAVLDAHRLGGDGLFLEKAHQLVRRCIHPCDEPAAMGLLEAEKRWSYTVFLQALGKYLAYLEERGDLGDNWQYARASLVRYARWMRDCERPYLDHPEELEFPNETWAAQELRKAAVLEGAARYVEEEERGQFLDRAAFFFNGSIEALAEWRTRGLTRPLVLLLAYGYRSLFGVVGPGLSAGVESQNPDWGLVRPVFVPYQRRVVRRATLLAALGATSGLALGVWWLLS